MTNIWDDTGPMNDEGKSVAVTSKMKQEKVAEQETIYVEPLNQPLHTVQQQANRRMETSMIIKRPAIEGARLRRDIYLLRSRFKGDLVLLLKLWGFLLE